MKREEFENSIGKVLCDKNQMSYILERVDTYYALISVRKGKCTLGYEVWKNRAYSPQHNMRPNHMRFPCNEDFGNYAWFYSTKEQALEKYGELTNGI